MATAIPVASLSLCATATPSASARWAANTLGTVFLCLINIAGSSTADNAHNGNNNKIGHHKPPYNWQELLL